MKTAGRWMRHPQSVWVRKLFFQIHLWSGLILAIYIFVMSATGTVLIYRRELSKSFSAQPRIAIGPGPRLSAEELTRCAIHVHPGYNVTRVFQPRRSDQPVELWMERGQKKMQRLFNPYTGADLGNSLEFGFRAVLWLVDVHDNLLSGRTGHLVNGVGGAFVTLLSLSGIVIWWPGIDRWRRSLVIDWHAGANRLNWSLHSSLGFWSLLFILMWGISGVYLAWPAPFNGLIDYLEPSHSRDLRLGDQFLSWLARLHFGRFPSLTLKLVWTFFGLMPIALLITGVLMWWNRVLVPWSRRRSSKKFLLQTENPRTQGERTTLYNVRST